MRTAFFRAKDSTFVFDEVSAVDEGGGQGWQHLSSSFIAPEDGLVQYYVANESSREVRFDDHALRTGSLEGPQFYHYYPFGLSMTGICTQGPASRQFATGRIEGPRTWQDHGARFYDRALGRWNGVDPLAANTPEWSTYSYSFNSPVRFLDQDGRSAGDFISEKGKYLGNDGINDGKVYVVKTTQKYFDSQVAVDGITKSEARQTEEFIANNSGNTEAFAQNPIAYNNSVEIEGDAIVRQGMMDIVNKDDGTRGPTPANNREYGGVVVSGKVIESPPGPVSRPENGASIMHPNVRNASTVFHSHPSGTSGLSRYNQAPHPDGDVTATTGTRYVFGRRDGLVYIYGGSGVKATVPQKYFVIPRR